MADEMQQGDSVLIGRCRNCEHRERSEEKLRSGAVVVFGYCKKRVGEVGEFPDEDGCIGDGRPEDGTGEGRTGPMFGCVHFKRITE